METCPKVGWGHNRKEQVRELRSCCSQAPLEGTAQGVPWKSNANKNMNEERKLRKGLLTTKGKTEPDLLVRM